MNDRQPLVRPLRAVRSALVLGLIAVVVAITALAWQADTHRQAHRALEAAVARDSLAIDALAKQYHADRATNEPPRLAQRDLVHIQDLTTVLGNRTPQLPTHLRPSAANALRAVRIASHEATVIALLSAAEYLDAAAQHRPPSLSAVRVRYEHEIRPDDPSLDPWANVISGTSFTRARNSVNQLTRELAS